MHLFRAVFLILMCACASQSAAQTNPFADAWVLDPAASQINVQSIKDGDVAEVSRFTQLSGGIDQDGLAQIRITLDSIDTGLDIRNVRMRFLFFETFDYPEASIVTLIAPEQLKDLNKDRRAEIELPYTLNLRGISRSAKARVFVSLIDNDSVAVTSVLPMSVTVRDFGLLEGLAKLEDAAAVSIVPTGTVTFDFVFAREGSTRAQSIADKPILPPQTEAPTAQVEEKAPVAPTLAQPRGATASVVTPVAAVTSDPVACQGRFEFMTRQVDVAFARSSSKMHTTSNNYLNVFADVLKQCSSLKVEIAGHTDSDGSRAKNETLSKRRADAVKSYLVQQGIASDRLNTKGYGESRPLVRNSTRANKAKNRRIEFSLVSGATK